MSSSVFIEQLNEHQLHKAEHDVTSKADSNLVVVYGKKSVSFDRDGLKNLIEEKSLSTISVIRLTSPTPSMQDEAENKDSCESNQDSNNESVHSEDVSEEESSDEEGTSKKTRVNKSKHKSNENDSPIVVGLTVEDFYPPGTAKELAREILKYAGLSTKKQDPEHDFQLYVIQNDHCYTPYTSPSEISLKRDEGSEKSISKRKIIAGAVTNKNLLNKKNLLSPDMSKKMDGSELKPELSNKSDKNVFMSPGESNASTNNKSDNVDDDDYDDDGSCYSQSDVSVESENDRDSDLDFDLNNRNGRRRKTASRKIRRNNSIKRHQHIQDVENIKSPLMSPKINTSRSSNEGRFNKETTTLQSVTNKYSSESAHEVQQPAVKKCLVLERKHNYIENTDKATTSHVSVSMRRLTPSVQKISTNKQMHIQSAKKNEVNNESDYQVEDFTNVNEIKTPSDRNNTTDSRLSNNQSLGSSSNEATVKVIMPLEISSTTKNQPQTQISIQAHQSLSESRKVDDNQINLNEPIINKSMHIEKEELNKDIPEIVKMLESTEKDVLDQSYNRSVENIDIADAPLLEALADDIPEDLIQHVVELMEGNKTLKEEVERHALLNSNVIFPPNQSTNLHLNKGQYEEWNVPGQTEKIDFTIPTQNPKLLPKQSKSIIEATISNVTISESQIQPNIPKEPVQIIRGNGRVITLPPIEAPTTRAKRRAQVQPKEETYKLNASIDSISDLKQKTTKGLKYDSISLSSESDLTQQDSRNNSFDSVTATKANLSKSKIVVSRKKQQNLIKKGTQLEHEMINKKETNQRKEEDEDDPKKLWCICRQPHNNRFMICCDSCEDWFHGTCVNVTKNMGIEMEEKGIEWTCPKCIKNKELKKQRKITDSFTMKTPTLQESSPVAIKQQSNSIQISSGNILLQRPSGADSSPQTKRQNDLKKVKTGLVPIVKKIDVKNLPTQAQTYSSVVNETSTPTKCVIVSHNINHTEKAADIGCPETILKYSDIKNTKQKNSTKVERIAQKTITSPQHNINAKNPTSSQNSVSHSHQVLSVEKSQIKDAPACIVCKKNARPNSIYCSDDCIRKHAQNALITVSKQQSSKTNEPIITSPSAKVVSEETKKKTKGLFEDLLSMADRKPKVERVYVFERKTGRILTGNSAPTTTNLKKWLQDNPTFEVVQPGSVQALSIEKFKLKQRSSPQLTGPATLTTNKNPATYKTSAPSLSPNVSNTSVASSNINRTEIRNDLSPNTFDKIVGQLRNQTQDQQQQTPKTSVPRQVAKTSSNASSSKREKCEKEKPKETRDERIVNKKQATFETTTNLEPVRLNVRRTLKEQLLVRINERSSEKERLTKNEVETFATETENEMFQMFNCDIGSKYKAKYRSLMFNIKDRKNQTLFEKICAKIIEPKQLVRMTPEELASQELAQWRENEAKHQLEMIKKSELDLLSCAKNYVLKTHKGEEVIEGKTVDRVNLDLTIPVEDVVSVLNSSTVSSTTEFEGQITESTPNPKTAAMESYHKSNAISKEEANQKKLDNSSKQKSTSMDREKHSKSKSHHKDGPKSKKRSRSRSKDKHHRSSHNDDRGHKDEIKVTKELEYDYDHSRESRSREDKKSQSFEKQTNLVTQCNTSKDNNELLDRKTIDNKKDTQPIETFNLIDQILESSKTIEEAANIAFDKKIEKIKSKPLQQLQPHLATSTTTDASSTILDDKISFSSGQSSHITTENDQDQQPSSTINIATPPEDPYLKYICDDESLLWAGNINMIDVASFQIILQAISGKCDLLENDLPNELDVVGRIGPDTVWDYISKIKKSPNKEIAIISLLPSGSSETTAYTILYKYLDKRKRLGVIKTTSPNIKDFYIIPLSAGKLLPTVLQPIDNTQFFEDDYRPDMLLGVIIRIMGKRSTNLTTLYNKTSQQKSKKTCPESPKRKADDNSGHRFKTNKMPRITKSSNAEKCDEIDVDAIIKAPISSKLPKTITKPIDLNEPYSPGGGSSEDDVSNLTQNTSIDASNNQEANEELKRKMDDINRQIEAQKMQIAGLLNVESAKYTQSNINPALARISIPSNLSQILASIQSMPEPPPAPISPSASFMGSMAEQEYGEDEYNPESRVPMSRDYPAKSQEQSTSRLAQLTEAELLSLVPDDIILDPGKKNLDSNSICEEPPDKKVRWAEPPPPGIE